MTRAIALLLLAGALLGCQRPPSDARWLETPVEVAVPAGAGSRFPHLAASGDGIVVSWLEPAGPEAFSLRYSRLVAGRWSPPVTVQSGRDWFVNWADFPSVVPVDERLWLAHWLQQRPGGVYAYDVRLVASTDGGRSWSAPFSPHDDGTATEHGFVTLLPRHESALAVWLDGRHTTGEHDHSGASAGAMTLRAATLDAGGDRLLADLELDGRTCDCCQTDAAATREGAVVVYRDRGTDEVRDIALVRLDADGWSAPTRVAEDGWRIDGCPVNGPAVDARGDDVVVAWFTAPDRPRVRLAFSGDGGRTFSPAIEVAGGRVAGRVDAVLLPDGRAAVSWLADTSGGAEIRVQAFDRNGSAGAATTVARTNSSRAAGFPQMLLDRDGLLFAWTEPGDSPRVRAARAPLR